MNDLELKINGKIYDIAIIGSGMAGGGAAVYASRFGLSTIIFGDLPGGTITSTHLVENYPGFKKISGLELGQKLLEHATAFGAELNMSTIHDVQKEGDFFKIYGKKEIWQSRTIIIATGTGHKYLNVPGEKEFANKGVSYCATCDGAFFKNKIVCIVGAGDSAVKESLFLAQHVKHVYILCRKEDVHPEPINRERMLATVNIEVKPFSEIEEIFGDEQGVKGVKLKNGSMIEVEGVFVEVGRVARTDAFQSLGLKTDKEGRVLIDILSRTNVKGIFAAGDITAWDQEAKWDQGIVGVAEGVKAAYSAFNYLG